MKKNLQNTLLAVAAAIACLSVPASATTIITLNIGNSTGSNFEDVSGTISGTLYIEQILVTDPGDPDNNHTTYTDTINLSPADDFSLNFNSTLPTLTIVAGTSVQAPFSNLTASAPIETGTTGLGYTCSSCSSSTLSLALANSVSITGVLANFLTDLGLPTTPSSLAISGGITGSGGTISSDSITLIDTGDVTPTPEPSSIFLLGAGLAIAAAIARKGRFGAAKSQRACA